MRRTLLISAMVCLITIIGLFLVLHITPKMALRTHVFSMGHPIAAVTTGIVDDDYHNRTDEKRLEKANAKAYTLTNPPIEKATQSELRNYKVKKVGLLYFADYLGEL